MQRFKKAIAVMLVLLIVFSVVGCKSKGYTDDEEIAAVAGDETQADIDKTEKTDGTEQVVEEKEQNKETANEEQAETTDKNVETPSESNSDKPSEDTTSKDIVDEQPSVEKVEDVTSKQDTTTEKKVNQVALEKQPHDEVHNPTPFIFYNIDDLVTALKTRKITVYEEEKALLQKYYSTIVDEQDRTNILSRIGTINDDRFDIFKTDKMKFFYKLKNDEIPGFEIDQIRLSSNGIGYNYKLAEGSTYSEDSDIFVRYYRPDDFVTDSYFDDYIEYYKNTTVTEDGFIYEDYCEKHGFSVIMFPVENTIIEIRGHGDMANYEALKKLCVAEKVVVK